MTLERFFGKAFGATMSTKPEWEPFADDLGGAEDELQSPKKAGAKKRKSPVEKDEEVMPNRPSKRRGNGKELCGDAKPPVEKDETEQEVEMTEVASCSNAQLLVPGVPIAADARWPNCIKCKKQCDPMKMQPGKTERGYKCSTCNTRMVQLHRLFSGRL